MDYSAIAETYRTRNVEIERTKRAAEDAAYSVYSTAVHASEAIRDKAREEARAAHDKATAEALAVKGASDKEAADQAAKASEELLAELTGAEGDGSIKLFAWMITSGWFRRFPEHCNIILEAMPLSLQGLRDLSTNHGWCGDFDTFLREALAADAIPGVPVAEAVEYTLTSTMESAGLGSRSKEAIKSLFERLVKLIPAEELAEETVPSSQERDVESARS